MPLNIQPKATIASQILKRVFAIYLALAILLTLIHLYVQYQDTKKVVSNELDITNAMVAPGLAKALWDYNHEQIEKTLKGMLLLPYIEKVVLTDDSGKQFSYESLIKKEFNDKYIEDISVTSFNTLNHSVVTNTQVKNISIGTLTIYGDRHVLYHRLKTSFALVIINAMIKTIALWFIFLWVGRQMLSKPLQKLTNYTQKFNIDTVDTPQVNLGANNNNENNKNELGILQDAYNQMGQRLHQNFKQLSDLKNSLEVQVETRTSELQKANIDLEQEVLAHKKAKALIAEKEFDMRHLVEDNNIVGWQYDLIKEVFTYVSSHAEVLFGYPLASWENKGFWEEHIYPEDKFSTIETCKKRTLMGENYSMDYRMIKSNGELIWLKDIVSVTKDNNNKPIALRGFFIDIDERKKAIEREMQANKAKSEFLANMSHELRTPMHGILSYAKMGMKKSDKEAQEKYHRFYKNIKISADRLMTLLNDLLDLAKLESGKMVLKFEKASIMEVAKSCLLEQQARLDEMGIKNICHNCSPDLAQIDAIRIGQVIMNFLSNAIKYTGEGQHIDFDLVNADIDTPEGNKLPALMMSVRDYGKGIPEGEEVLVFDKFVQSSNETLGTTKGTGLGLPICKEIIELHHGKIWAENHPDGGAIFSFVIPVEQPVIPHPGSNDN